MSSTTPKIRALTPALQTVACEELNEQPHRIAEDLQKFKDWLAKQPHLKTRTDDQFLLSFLRGSKYSLEKAKQKLDNFYTLRTNCPQYYGISAADFDRCIAYFKTGVFSYLPKPEQAHGPRINIIRFGAMDLNNFDFTDYSRTQIVLSEILLWEDDNANVAGVRVIVDFANCTAQHFLRMTPTFLKNTALWIEKCYTLRVKGVHYVDIPGIAMPVFDFFKPILPKKVQDRTFLHPNSADLRKHISPEFLPKEHGGTNSSIADCMDDWVQRMESFREYFLEESQYGTNEKLRVGKPLDIGGNLGIEGTFRKLEVD